LQQKVEMNHYPTTILENTPAFFESRRSASLADRSGSPRKARLAEWLRYGRQAPLSLAPQRYSAAAEPARTIWVALAAFYGWPDLAASIHCD